MGLGLAAMRLGAGRATANDRIDPAVGIELLVRRGDAVTPGTPLARVHTRPGAANVGPAVLAAFVTSDAAPPPALAVIGRLTHDA
jgi:thymidine phosphorylase